MPADSLADDARSVRAALRRGKLGAWNPSGSPMMRRLPISLPHSSGSRATRSTRRPLSDEQRVHAAADVAHLLALHDSLVQRLEEAGRLTWALDECEERRVKVRTRPRPETAWWRIKGARQLRGRSRGVAQAVA